MAMEDDWIFLGGGGVSDSASDDGSDSDSGFAIVRRGSNNKGGDDDAGCSVDDDAPAPERVAAVAVPHSTPPGLSFKVVSYSEAFSASASSSSEDGEQPGCNGSPVEAPSAPSVDVAAAPTVNCPEATDPVLYGEAHSELASGMDVDQGGAEEEVEDEDSESCQEEDEDSESCQEDDDDDDTDSSSDDDTDSSSDDDMFSSSDEEDEDTFSSSDEDYTESFSDEEMYSETCSLEEDDDDAESSFEEDGLESCGEVGYVEIYEDDDDEPGEEQEEDEDAAECSCEADDAESTGDDDAECTGEEEGDDALEISGQEEEEERSRHVIDVAENGKKDIFALLFPRATTACEANAEAEQGAANANGDVTSGSDMDTDCSDMEEDDCFKSDEEDDTVDVAENVDQAILDMLFPRATACGCGANMEDYEHESEHGYIVDYEAEEDDDMDTNSSDTEDDIVGVAQNGNQDMFESEHGNIDDSEEAEEGLDGSLFDMLLPRDHAIDDDDIDTDSSGVGDNWLESDEEEDDIVNVAENRNRDISDMLLLWTTACGANTDESEEEEEEEEEEEGSLFDLPLPRENEAAATATWACECDYSAGPSHGHGTRRPEFAARSYDDVDTDSDMEEGDDEVVAVAADAANGTSLHGLPGATAGGGGWGSGFASRSHTERQASWEDHLRRQLAAEREALESSGQQQQQRRRSYDDVDDTCDLPVTAAGSCARTAGAQFTARAQRELYRALAREAAAAAEALETALGDCDCDCPPAKCQATGDADVTRPAVAKRDDVPPRVDFTFLVAVYVLVYLVVSLLSLALPGSK